MKYTLLLILVLLGCEPLEVQPQEELPTDPHKFIVESIYSEARLYWDAFTELTDHANILLNHNCNGIPWSDLEKEILEGLRQEAYDCLLVVVGKLYSIKGLVDNDILTLYIDHYENNERFILNLLKD